LTEASNNLYELIKGRNLTVYPDDDMRLAISRAVAVVNTQYANVLSRRHTESNLGGRGCATRTSGLAPGSVETGAAHCSIRAG
jgi:hypothetical protein